MVARDVTPFTSGSAYRVAGVEVYFLFIFLFGNLVSLLWRAFCLGLFCCFSLAGAFRRGFEGRKS